MDKAARRETQKCRPLSKIEQNTERKSGLAASSVELMQPTTSHKRGAISCVLVAAQLLLVSRVCPCCAVAWHSGCCPNMRNVFSAESWGFLTRGEQTQPGRSASPAPQFAQVLKPKRERARTERDQKYAPDVKYWRERVAVAWRSPF